MSSQVISYRLSTDEVLVLRQKAFPGESDNQTAQRLMRETLGLSTQSTEPSTASTATLDERIESIVEERLSSFTGNQNELLSRLQERLQELEARLNDMPSRAELQANQAPVDTELTLIETPVDSVDKPVDIEPNRTQVDVDVVDEAVDNSDRLLTQKELSERLGVHSATLSRNRSKPNFADWSSTKDPEGLAWRYLSESERYILSTTMSTASTVTESSENLAAWKARVDAVVGAL